MTLHWYNLDWPLLYTSKYGGLDKGGVTMPKKKKKREKKRERPPPQSKHKKPLVPKSGLPIWLRKSYSTLTKMWKLEFGRVPHTPPALHFVCYVVLFFAVSHQVLMKNFGPNLSSGFDIQPSPKCQSCINWKLFLKK